MSWRPWFLSLEQKAVKWALCLMPPSFNDCFGWPRRTRKGMKQATQPEQMRSWGPSIGQTFLVADRVCSRFSEEILANCFARLTNSNKIQVSRWSFSPAISISSEIKVNLRLTLCVFNVLKFLTHKLSSGSLQGGRIFRSSLQLGIKACSRSRTQSNKMK